MATAVEVPVETGDVSADRVAGPTQRRYKIFISSSFEDLKEARTELILATLRLRHIPSAMELFHAGPEVLRFVEEEIASSDVFVVLLGARLGSRVSASIDALSFTEREFELAIRHQLPILAFLLGDEEYRDARRALSPDSKERDHEEQLRRFRERVRRTPNGESRIVEFFSASDVGHLTEKYGLAVGNCIATFPESRGGWIQGKHYDALRKQIVLHPSVTGNPFFQRFARQLGAFGTVSQRTRVRANAKMAIAEYFWERYFSRLAGRTIDHIHFESGSSIGYVSRVFIESVRLSPWFYRSGMDSHLHLRTNNLLTYLDLLVQDPPWRPIDVQLQPYGCFCPDDYGGTYGTLNFAIPEPAPGPGDSIRSRLSDDSQAHVDELAKEMGRDFNKHGLVLMSASGLDTRGESPDVPYPGPHVGSYQNMLFKRCLLSLACPRVLFLDSYKFGYNFRFNNCHPVCDASLPWEEVKQAGPLAIALAADSYDDQMVIGERLAQYGFAHVDCEEPKSGKKGAWSVIAGNDAFEGYFRRVPEHN